MWSNLFVDRRNISEVEFARICSGLAEDREEILKHNPIGTAEETILWMLLSVLNSFLSLSEMEAPCFTARPDAATFRNAVLYVLKDRRVPDFDPLPYIDKLVSDAY